MVCQFKVSYIETRLLACLVISLDFDHVQVMKEINLGKVLERKILAFRVYIWIRAGDAYLVGEINIL